MDLSLLCYRLLNPKKDDTVWRLTFILGLFSGGLILKWTMAKAFTGTLVTPLWTIVLAGLLVGFGTIMGSGCTSGHGICGISRLSLRSIIATIIFICSGIISVYFFRKLGIIS